MKAKLELEFDLDSMDDRLNLAAISTEEYKKWRSVVWELNQHLRGIVKYCDDSYTEDYLRCVDETRSKIFELMNDENLTLD